MEGSAEDDVFLQYSYFTSLNLSQNCYFLKIILSEIPHLPNHSSCKNSFKPAFTLDFPCFFPIPSATFNFLIYSLSRNPNMFHSFVLSSAPSPSLRHSQSPFHSETLSLHIPLQFSSLSYNSFSTYLFILGSPMAFTTQKFSLLTVFSFLHKPLYYLPFNPWKLLHCLSNALLKQFFFRPIISIFSYLFCFLLIFYSRGKLNFLDF